MARCLRAMGRTLGVVAGLLALAVSPAQQPRTPEGEPRQWAEAATAGEVAILERQGTFSVRYREHKVDAKTDRTREVIETSDGTVARLVERYGKPISAAEDAAERQRLRDAAASPAAFAKHHKRDESTRIYAVELLKLLPQAMLYSYVPGQPQTPDAQARQVVMEFTPNPGFRPPTMLADLLTGLAGRVWVDAETRHIVRVEARVLRPVNFGWGVVARIAPGGSIVFEQTGIGNGQWMFSHLTEHMVVRALMVKTMPQDTEMWATGFRPMERLIGYQEAIKMLLEMPVAVR